MHVLLYLALACAVFFVMTRNNVGMCSARHCKKSVALFAAIEDGPGQSGHAVSDSAVLWCGAPKLHLAAHCTCPASGL